MAETVNKRETIEKLKQDILKLEGFRAVLDHSRRDTGLGPVEEAFPNKVFPIAAVHEFISPTVTDAAATTGFITGLVSHLMNKGGMCIWVRTQPVLFPPGLKVFGIEPDRIIFIDLNNEKDVLWTIEEALKCESLTAVIAELKEINLTESRRLQLAVEKSRVTGFLHRRSPQKIENIACVSRWQISPLASSIRRGIPGVGYPSWNVDLQKVRNGKPGRWQIQWAEGRFDQLATTDIEIDKVLIQQTG